jgi:hypothetical protein
MHTSRLDSVIELIKSLSVEEQATVLRLLMGDSTTEHRSAVEPMGEMEQQIKAYEMQYQMSSDEFYRRFQAGELGDSADFFEWNAYYEMLMGDRAA